MKTRGKVRNPKEIQYDALVAVPFDVVALGASILNTAIQARLPLGLDFKCFRAEVVLGGTAAGTCSFNVVVGEGAEGSVGADDTSDFASATPGVITKAAAGSVMFTADQAVTMTVGQVQKFVPTNPEVVYGQGTELTLRFATSAAATASENLKVILYGKFIDTQTTKPLANAAGLNFSTDL